MKSDIRVFLPLSEESAVSAVRRVPSAPKRESPRSVAFATVDRAAVVEMRRAVAVTVVWNHVDLKTLPLRDSYIGCDPGDSGLQQLRRTKLILREVTTAR